MIGQRFSFAIRLRYSLPLFLLYHRSYSWASSSQVQASTHCSSLGFLRHLTNIFTNKTHTFITINLHRHNEHYLANRPSLLILKFVVKDFNYYYDDIRLHKRSSLFFNADTKCDWRTYRSCYRSQSSLLIYILHLFITIMDANLVNLFMIFWC